MNALTPLRFPVVARSTSKSPYIQAFQPYDLTEVLEAAADLARQQEARDKFFRDQIAARKAAAKASN